MIKIKNLCKSFHDLEVFSDLNLDISKNQINCIMAKSGAGKTTLVNILLGFTTPNSGEVLGSTSNISMVFQEDRLVENISSLKNILIACGQDKKDIAIKLFEKFELDYTKKVSTLSGGMKRRVAIIRALLFDAELYIFDEPFKGLDDKTKEIVMEQFKQLDKTVIIITHNINEVEFFELNLCQKSNEFALYK